MSETARTKTGRIVEELVLENAGKAGIVEREFLPGSVATVRRPAPLLAIQAARQIAEQAQQLVTEFAREARGDGANWAEIGNALGISSNDAVPVAELAFETVAQDNERVSWRCGSCGAYVSDSGPYTGYPDSYESGHAENCKRHIREIAAYEAQSGSN